MWIEWINVTQPHLWGTRARFTLDLRLIAVPKHSPAVDRFWTSYPQKNNHTQYFLGVYYILALSMITPHIWGVRFGGL